MCVFDDILYSDNGFLGVGVDRANYGTHNESNDFIRVLAREHRPFQTIFDNLRAGLLANISNALTAVVVDGATVEVVEESVEAQIEFLFLI